MARIVLILPESHSLKDKRMVMRRIKDRARERLGVIVSEVGSPTVRDSWQRGELGVAVASSDRARATSLIDDVVRLAIAAGGAEVASVARDVITFDGAPAALDDDALAAPAIDGARTGAGDKAVAGDDWIPAAWREEH